MHQSLLRRPQMRDGICHNDLGPFNVVFKRGRPIAIIDWDNACPGPRMWDVACALWRFTPLWGSDAWWGGDWEGNGWRLSLETKASRMQQFRRAYGRELFPDWTRMLDLIEARMHASELTVNARAVAGSPFYERFRRSGAFALPDLAWLRHNRAALMDLLDEDRSNWRKSAATAKLKS
jgi:aminoglycoside phosphotransferase (APT) family kinase protein